MRKVLWVSDGVVPTGFGRVAHAIISRLEDKFDIHHLALKYDGTPHEYNHKIYPASLGGDIYGVNQLKRILAKNSEYFDTIFLFNDMPIIDMYLENIKDIINKDKTKIVVYFPVDSKFPRIEWFKNYNIVDEVVTYTNFGKREVERVLKFKNIHVIYHGVDRNKFPKIDKSEAIAKIFGESLVEELKDSFIILNANRNQPRKRIDLTIAGFAEFAHKNMLTPEDVRLYLHMGTRDAGWDILRLSNYYKVQQYILLTANTPYHPYVDDETLAHIYNIADAGINTSSGEGFGLFPVELASVGKPQIVPDNSVHRELFGDYAYYIRCNIEDWAVGHTVLFKSATKEEVAYAIEDMFYSEEKLESWKPFEDKKFDWDYISEQFGRLL